MWGKTCQVGHAVCREQVPVSYLKLKVKSAYKPSGLNQAGAYPGFNSAA